MDSETAQIDHKLSGNSDAEKLSEEFAEIQDATTLDGFYEGIVTNVSDRGDQIVVSVRPVGSEVEKFRFDKPKPWTDDFEYARLLAEYGGSPGAQEEFIGNRVLLEMAGRGWELVIPEPAPTWRERVGDRLPESADTVIMAVWVVGTAAGWAVIVHSPEWVGTPADYVFGFIMAMTVGFGLLMFTSAVAKW